MRKLFLTALLISCFNTPLAHAFPEMIRMGYVNCTSCHVSPNGGGVLNEYGRQTSADVLSTWGGENEAKPFYNVFSQPAFIDSGAFARAVQTGENNAAVSNGYFWWMEADVEARAKFGADGRWSADLAFGISPDVMNGIHVPGTSSFISRRQYLMYQATEAASIRAGKFIPDYGIYFADHTIPTRQGIGFDEGQETYNIEYSYHGEKWSGSLTGDLGRIDDASLNTEKGLVGNAAIAFAERYKVGWSAFWGTQNGNSRELTGPYALLGFNENLYLVGEADAQFTQNVGSPATRGVVTYERFGYVPIKGIHIYLMEQTYVYDFAGNFNPMNINPQYGIMSNRLLGFGPGAYWFPRPHFYIQAEIQQQWSPSFPSAQTAAFLVGTVYL